MSVLVQGIWSASVCELHSKPVIKPLYTDAGSGIVFHLGGEVTLGEKPLTHGVLVSPVEKQSQQITLFPGATLAGIRFHPAIGYGVLGQHFDRLTLLERPEDQRFRLYDLYDTLQSHSDNASRIDTLYTWLNDNVQRTDLIPSSLEQALECIQLDITLGELDEQIALSQRQIERLFKHWMDMTPKQYQRILRVKKAIDYLRQYKCARLVEVSQQFGFSDQAHMTREFRAIARITPGKL
ncbi:AraC family transcriptional regulator [Vibrio navarrensis]|uniref:AraC family transcriptional regulator n=1 Tax=Vibrio navarrensis TaxID=29495 RepID=UPI001D05B103|nr:helix-turn-helix domain-containing protein [Vibrio navarrensis]MBE4594425.1 AraC family transcriptional regulator [Vibrio navarrensis]